MLHSEALLSVFMPEEELAHIGCSHMKSIKEEESLKLRLQSFC